MSKRVTRSSLGSLETKENCDSPIKPTKTPGSVRSIRGKRLSTINEKVNKKIDVSPPKIRKFREPSSSPEIAEYLEQKLNLSSPKSDKKEATDAPKSKYSSARRALGNNVNDTLLGRENEYEELSRFLSDTIENQGSGSMYISGPPGTGKTATLTKLIKSPLFSSKIKMVYVNCTSISSIGSIYKKICTELNLESDGNGEKDYLATIERYLKGRHKTTMFVLDEIDQLAGNKQTILYHIFEWPGWTASKLILIGIANSLDLTDRLLARLQAKCELKPKLMHFPPYKKQQIIDIFKNRLEENGILEMFPPATLQLLAAKVSSVSGDIRRALDIGRRVIEIAEKEKRKANAPKNLEISQLESELDCKPIQQETPRVQIKEVMAVLNQVYGASQNLDTEMEDSFPLQQKLLICSLLLIMKNDKNKDITMGRLHEVYKKVCAKRNIVPVDQAEFNSLGTLVETRGILRITKKKEPRLNRVGLQWDEEEVNNALKDKQLITSILNDLTVLSR